MSTEGDFDGAAEEIEALIKSSDGDDAVPYVFKANTLAQKVGFHFMLIIFFKSCAYWELFCCGCAGYDAHANGSTIWQSE